LEPNLLAIGAEVQKRARGVGGKDEKLRFETFMNKP
jgi:hypothetical protein